MNLPGLAILAAILAGPLAAEERPAWAAEAGRDAVGAWAWIDLAGQRLVLRAIPAGSFPMGSETGDGDQKPVRQVTLSAFWLAESEVTQAQWQAVMGANPSANQGPALPVERVSWQDAQEFLAKANALRPGLGATLPSEAQWEYACRAGTAGDHSGDLAAAAWYYKNADDRTRPVMTRAANPWGLYDMHGNVWEWCLDWHGDYAAGPATDPAGAAAGTLRVRRGGDKYATARCCRTTYRSKLGPQARNDGTGMRILVPAAQR